MFDPQKLQTSISFFFCDCGFCQFGFEPRRGQLIPFLDRGPDKRKAASVCGFCVRWSGT